MQVCKKNLWISLLISSKILMSVQAQNSALEMPQMPSMPTMPGSKSSLDMPSVSMPAAPSAPVSPSSNINNFYVPGFQNQKKSGSVKTADDNSIDGNNAAAGSVSDTSAKTTSDSDAKTLAASLAKKNLLTAGDITSLYDSGLFGNVSSISSVDNSKSTEVLLKQILERLDELKASQAGVSIEKKQELANYQADAKTFKTRDPKILRFRINGYNIADSVSTYFFSDTEDDGSFMFTGDRTYYVNGISRSETFYMLFKAVRSNGAAVTFEVVPSIVQDSENPNSFVYRFAKMQNLRAEKTGNLVALHSSQDGMNVDLLLDIDGEN